MAFFSDCIHPIAKIAETRILSSDCVDALPRERLSRVVYQIFHFMYNQNSYCVDFVLAALAAQGFPDRLPTDWVKSD